MRKLQGKEEIKVKTSAVVLVLIASFALLFTSCEDDPEVLFGLDYFYYRPEIPYANEQCIFHFACKGGTPPYDVWIDLDVNKDADSDGEFDNDKDLLYEDLAEDKDGTLIQIFQDAKDYYCKAWAEDTEGTQDYREFTVTVQE